MEKVVIKSGNWNDPSIWKDGIVPDLKSTIAVCEGVEHFTVEKPFQAMTKEEFELMYATKSKVTVEQLHEHGLHAIPCSCEYEGCVGWVIGDSDIENETHRIVERG